MKEELSRVKEDNKRLITMQNQETQRRKELEAVPPFLLPFPYPVTSLPRYPLTFTIPLAPPYPAPPYHHPYPYPDSYLSLVLLASLIAHTYLFSAFQCLRSTC